MSAGEFWVVAGPWAATAMGAMVLGAIGYVVKEIRAIRKDVDERLQLAHNRIDQISNEHKLKVQEIYRRSEDKYVRKDVMGEKLDRLFEGLGGLKHSQDALLAEMRDIRDRVVKLESQIE